MNTQTSTHQNFRTIGESLKKGLTLPASWYTDSDIFDLEQKKIFSRSWHYAGRTDQIPNPGDYFACKVGSVPIIILRDEKNSLKAFVNVCKHRGAEILLEGTCGNRKTLQCHYHAWTWGLDGQLRSAPRSEGESCFNKKDFPLTQIRIEALGPFIFVNPDPTAPSWEETIGELPQLLQNNGTDLSRLKYRERRVYDMKSNWKVVVENFLECYHCPIAHKGFSSLIDLNEYQVIPYKYFSVQKGPLKESVQKSEKQFDVSEGTKEGLYNFLWPNFMVNTYPGRGNASTNIIIPVSPDRTIAIYEFFLDESIEEKEASKIVDFIDEVQREDVIICESVQRGLQSGFYHQGRLILSKENGIQHFQQLVQSSLALNDGVEKQIFSFDHIAVSP